MTGSKRSPAELILFVARSKNSYFEFCLNCLANNEAFVGYPKSLGARLWTIWGWGLASPSLTQTPPMITERFEPQWSWKIYREEGDQGEGRGMEGGERRRNEMNSGRGVKVTVKLVLTLRSDYRLLYAH